MRKSASLLDFVFKCCRAVYLMDFFKVDAFCKHLKAGEQIEVWGTNFLAFPIGQFPEAFKERYERTRAEFQKVMNGSGLYMYPLEYLHITLGPPALFTHEAAVPKHRREEVRFS